MTKYHTSPEEIKKPHDQGRFGEGLFFSNEPYYMTQAEDPWIYEIEEEEDDIISASDFFYRDDWKKLEPILDKIEKQFKVDFNTAQGLLDGSINLHDIETDIPDEDKGEYDYDLQKYAGEAAKLLGFKGVKLRDEQGASFLMNAKDIFHKMKLIK